MTINLLLNKIVLDNFAEKNPILIKNSKDYENISEKMLQKINTRRYTIIFRRVRGWFYIYKK